MAIAYLPRLQVWEVLETENGKRPEYKDKRRTSGFYLLNVLKKYGLPEFRETAERLQVLFDAKEISLSELQARISSYCRKHGGLKAMTEPFNHP